RRAPRADRRAPHPLCQAGRARERHRRGRLRLLVPGDLRPGGPSDSRLGQVPGAGRGRPPRQPAALGPRLRRAPMQRSTDRILTTHTGSLPRPPDLVEMIRAREEGEPFDAQAFAARVRSAVEEVVRKQVEAGVDVVSDGEMGKPSFATYVTHRLAGFGGENPELRLTADREAF